MECWDQMSSVCSEATGGEGGASDEFSGSYVSGLTDPSENLVRAMDLLPQKRVKHLPLMLGVC